MVTFEARQGLLEQQTQAIMAATQQRSDNLDANYADICRRVAALEALGQLQQPTVAAIEQVPSQKQTAPSAQQHLKLKPFNGETPLDLYLHQVNIIADANHWTEDDKARAVIAQLDRPALNVLHRLQGTRLTYTALVATLRDRFGDDYLQQAYYAELRSRRQQSSESLPELASSVERLSYKSFPGATADTLNRVGTAAFVDAISDPEVIKFFRLARPDTIRAAPTRNERCSMGQPTARSRQHPTEHNCKHRQSHKGHARMRRLPIHGEIPTGRATDADVVVILHSIAPLVLPRRETALPVPWGRAGCNCSKAPCISCKPANIGSFASRTGRTLGNCGCAF